MPVIPIPNRCIWCKKSPPEVGFNVNHVLPECVGNKYQQVLPVGVVCSTCNSYFGAKVEPKLLADPYFHVIAVHLSLVDPDDMNVFRSRIFDDQHQPTETVKAHLSVHADLSGSKLSLDIDYRISGNLGKEYSLKDLAWLSRAAHKIGFETLAWVHYVRGTEEPENIFSAQYDVVRAWARRGQPQKAVRPVLRRMSGQLKAEVYVRHWNFGENIGCEMKLFGDWYAVSLTSPQNEVVENLKGWVTQDPEGIWCLSDRLIPLADL